MMEYAILQEYVGNKWMLITYDEIHYLDQKGDYDDMQFIIKLLQDLSEDGWELVGARGNRNSYILKREKYKIVKG